MTWWTFFFFSKWVRSLGQYHTQNAVSRATLGILKNASRDLRYIGLGAGT